MCERKLGNKIIVLSQEGMEILGSVQFLWDSKLFNKVPQETVKWQR